MIKGVVAQLAEHLLCKQAVAGSNPAGSTIGLRHNVAKIPNVGLIAQLVRAHA